MGINQTTEEMIQMFLKYGTKQALSVDEFLLLRKQVVDEMLCGVRVNDIPQQQIIIENAPLVQQTTQQLPQQSIEQPTVITSVFDSKEEIQNDNKITQQVIVKSNPMSQPIEDIQKKQELSIEETEDINKNVKLEKKKEEKNTTKPQKPSNSYKKENVAEKKEDDDFDDDEPKKFSDKDFLEMMRQVDD